VQDFQPDASLLRELVNTVMPYGKYQGRAIADIPEHYLVWLAGRGFPQGKLGQLLALMYEIRLNGLEGLLKPLQGQRQHPH
jgi:uncharacterized protein (DUF3820 family)